jgi:hypothetical protein
MESEPSVTLAAASKAAETPLNGVVNGNPAVSLALLEGLGFLAGTKPSVGPTELADLLEERTLVEAERFVV